MALETESKLTVQPEDLARRRTLTERVVGRAARRSLSSVNFDTADHDLKTRVRPSAETKSEVGNRLLDDKLAEPTRMTRPPGDRGFTAEEALVQGVQCCLDHLQTLERPLLDDDDPEGVHQMRVRLRHLRSMLRVYRPLLPVAQYEALVGRLKWLAAALGPARDWDVFGDHIVAPVAEYLAEHADFGAFMVMIKAQRDHHREAARAAVRSPDYGELLLHLGFWLTRRSWRDQFPKPDGTRRFEPAARFAATVLDQRFRRVRKLSRRITKLSVAERHRLRIEVKRLRYTLQHFEGLFLKKRVMAFTDCLVRLQDDLGYLNDIANVPALVVELIEGCAAKHDESIGVLGGAIIGWHEHACGIAEERLTGDVGALLEQIRIWQNAGPGN